jgi:pyruvate dehydrogenase E1 component beta subunit
MLAEFGEKRVIDTPIAELGFTGCSRISYERMQTIVEYMTFNFCLVGLTKL